MNGIANFKAIQPFSALKDSLKNGYSRYYLFKDLVAGLTVGIIAIPLSMALAIASGVSPEHGLYTSIIAGIVIALVGGSRFNISGPTAAFVVILYPITQEFGLAGLLVATMMSGIILILMAIFRVGRFIEYISLSVTLGFTSGIGVVIGVLQLKDFLGLDIKAMPEHFVDKISIIIKSLPNVSIPDLAIGLTTIVIFLLWGRLKISIPGHLPAVIIATLLSLVFSLNGYEAQTIGSAFSYTLSDGSTGFGIPSTLPSFSLPWDAEGGLDFNLDLIQTLMPAAFSMAALGAIESLLCAVVLDNMTNTKHHSNNELFAQGIGNLIAPFFGGITATAAIARSGANVKSGAHSPISSVFHALLVLFSLLFLAPLLGYLPLASMAGLLLLVAWNMMNIKQVLVMLRRSGKSETLVYLTCFILTVLFDMVVAITVGVMLASLLFIKTIAEMTKLNQKEAPEDLAEVALFDITGPLFFAAADHIFDELLAKISLLENSKFIVLNCSAVTIIDAGGVHALQKFVAHLPKDKALYMCDLQLQPLKTLVRSNQLAEIKWINFCNNNAECIEKIKETLKV